MNKTININLAGLIFHIDEDAYQRLQHYLAAVRRSFTGTSGADEIMHDIESRIAELFLEKRTSELQVITIAHVEKVINIMGQPEDYEVDEELFEDQKPPFKNPSYNKSGKQLFRDTQNGYIGGVSSGIGHFLGIDAIWVRIIWVFLLFVSFGWILLVYILFWVLVPDAVTTNQRLTMMGKEVNISNIEENFKSGFETVTDEPASGSHQIVGQRGKRGTVRFFSGLGRILRGLLKAIVRIIGLFLFLIGSITFIALLISFITAGAIEIENHNITELIAMGTPVDISPWWMGLCILFVAGIPMLVLSILGLKLMVRNLRSIGLTAKICMFGIWIAAVIGGSIIIAKIAASQARDAKIATSQKFTIAPASTYRLEMHEDTYEYVDNINFNNNRFSIKDYDGITETRVHKIYTAITTTASDNASVTLYYRANGPSVNQAKQNASYIQYTYEVTDSLLTLNDYFKIAKNGRLNGQRVDVLVALPEGTVFQVNPEFSQRYNSQISNKALDLTGDYENTFKIVNGDLICLDCPILDENANSAVQEGDDVSLQNETTTSNSKSKDTTTTNSSNTWRYDGKDGVKTKR